MYTFLLGVNRVILKKPRENFFLNFFSQYTVYKKLPIDEDSTKILYKNLHVHSLQ